MANLKINSRAKEFIRCGKDPVYFINTYIKIQHPIRGMVPFETYPFQDDCIDSFRTNRHNVILKARQLGLSTIVASYVTWHCLFKQDSNILVIATKLDVAKNFINKCKYAIDSLPSWMREVQKIEIFTQEIRTSRGSTIKAIPTSPDAGRSEAVSLLVVDEAAHIKDFDSLWKGLWPTLSTGGNSIVLSTPKGTSNKFYELCINAEAGKNNFALTKLTWDVQPERDEKWYADETRAMSKKDIAQELDCSFIGSGDTFIDADIMERIRLGCKPPIARLGYDRNTWVWERPKIGHKYIISADTARGDGKDYSAFHVINASTGEVDMEYVGKAPPDKLAEMIAEQGKMYNEALICPENNSVGYATIQRLVKLGYTKIYDSAQKNLNIWAAIYENTNRNVNNPIGKLGLFMTGQARNNVLTKMEENLRNGYLKIYSTRFYHELQTFIFSTNQNNKVEAARGKNDDLIMSFAIGGWLFESVEVDELCAEQNKAILDAMMIDRQGSEEIIPGNPALVGSNCVFIPVAGSGGSGSDKTNPAMRNVESGKQRILHKDWAWLLK